MNLFFEIHPNYSKGFKSWYQFVAKLFCRSAQAKSPREICGGLALYI